MILKTLEILALSIIITLGISIILIMIKTVIKELRKK